MSNRSIDSSKYEIAHRDRNQSFPRETDPLSWRRFPFEYPHSIERPYSCVHGTSETRLVTFSESATKINLTFNWPPASRYQFAIRIAENFSEKYSFCSRARTISRSSINQEPLPANFSPDCSIFRHTVEALVRFFTAKGAVTYSMPGKILDDAQHCHSKRGA